MQRRAFYAREGFVEVDWTDGAGNEEHEPDVRCRWVREELCHDGTWAPSAILNRRPVSSSGDSHPAVLRTLVPGEQRQIHGVQQIVEQLDLLGPALDDDAPRRRSVS